MQPIFWIIAVILTFLNIYVNWIVAILILKLVIQAILIFNATKNLDEKDIFWLFPILEICLLSMQLYIFINNLFLKPKHWK